MIEQRPASQAFGELADELLAAGAGFRFQAKGRSMWPQIDDGEVLHVQQANAGRLKVGDIVLFRRGESREFKAHRIIRKQKDQFTTRGDASSEADGAIRGTQIVGKIIAKECGRSGRTVVLAGLRARCSFRVREMR